MQLAPFWHAAAKLSGRVDFSPMIQARIDPAALSARSLARHGLRLDHALALQRGPALQVAVPVLPITDPSYPPQLASLPFAPAVLFAQGNLTLLSRPGVAIVGSRACTALGSRYAAMLAAQVCAAGGVVVSGLARGIDLAAHMACPYATIAVLGQGFGPRLPGRRGNAAQAILDEGGLILSEFLPGTHATRFTFPQRNRIIAGLSRATVVVEAATRSGALITARQAADLGREVLAVPGFPLAPASAGCLKLIAEGATPVTDGKVVLEAARLDAPRPPAPPDHPLLHAIGDGATLDTLVQRTGLSAPQLMQGLASLELTGAVQRLPGELYRPT